MKLEKYSLDFGKKEKVLNYACQTYQNPVRDLSSVENEDCHTTCMPSGMQTNYEV